jgi:hypothetical protein
MIDGVEIHNGFGYGSNKEKLGLSRRTGEHRMGGLNSGTEMAGARPSLCDLTPQAGVDVPVQVNTLPAGEGATAASTYLYQGVAQGSASTYFFHCVTPSDRRCRYH